LSEENARLKDELAKARQVAIDAKNSWEKFRKERDFHKMHHRRVRGKD
jgi:sperm-associated antigen 16 protein